MENNSKEISFKPRSSPISIVESDRKKMSVRYSIILLMALTTLALLGYAFLFGFVLNKKDAITEATSMLDTEQLKEQQLYALRDSFRDTETEREALNRYFINEEKLVAFIEDIEQAGRHANVLLRFNFVNIRETENVLAMEFETLGSFSEIFYFLEIVEHIPVKISLEKFLLDKETPRGLEKRKATDTWHAVFTLTVLSFDPK
ncbi:MAG: hypothetical protein HYT93_02080 [Parcubacteria group bacterium]|nr:hypothetical protein [Parcubacteria group bacterium]